MPFLRKYGTGTGADVIVPIVKAGEVNFAVSADWTPASGDVQISKDGGTAANIGTLPAFITGVGWKFVFTDAELQCKRLNVNVVDSATKAVEDQHIVIETYGHASAMHPFDLGTASTPQTGDTYALASGASGFVATKAVLDVAAADVVNIDGAAMRGTDGAYTGTPPTAAAIADQVWDEATSGHTTAGTFGEQVKTSIDTILARLGAWTGTGVNTVLGAFKALLSKDASTPSDIGGTFDPESDSTEAIRDRGDAAWTSGSSSISVQPLSSTVGERVNEATITAYYGENGWTIGPVVVTDADGDAVNLASYTSLKLVIEDDHGTDILILEGNDITISGASNNQWTATGTSAVTTSTVSVDYRWAIRGISTGVDVVLGRGKVQVIYAPNED